MIEIDGARDERELAHSLMAVLRYRYEARTSQRVFRGESPQRIGRGPASPQASGALLDARSGRVLVAAEAIDARATSASVERALDRVRPLLAFSDERLRDPEGPREAPEVWMCAPAPDCDALAAVLAMPELRWVPYEITRRGEMRAADETAEALRSPSLEQLVAKRDAVLREHLEAGAKRAERFRESQRLLSLSLTLSRADRTLRDLERTTRRPRSR